MKERGNAWLRRADRFIGIPVVLGLAVLVRMTNLIRGRGLVTSRVQQSTSGPIRLTLLKSSAIGDTVMLSAIVRDIRNQWPTATLRIACGNSNASLARMIVGVDEVIVLPMSDLIGIWRMRGRLRSDVFIDFDSWPRINALIAHLSRSRTTVGFRTPGQHRHQLYDRVVEHSFATHEIQNYRSLLKVLDGWDAARMEALPEPWLRGAPVAGEVIEAGSVVLHMFAGGSQSRFKEWSADRWQVVAEACLALGYRVLLSGGPVDLEKNLAFRQRFASTKAIEVIPAGPLDRLLTLLARVDAVVSVDTGIAHLAGAAGTRTVALYGPTSPLRWGVIGPKVICIKDKQLPWINLGFESTQDGLPLQLVVDDVLPTLLGQLQRAAPSSNEELDSQRKASL